MAANLPAINLAKDSLHVWSGCITDVTPPPSHEALAVLSADELTRAQRFLRKADQLLFTTAHIALRQTLSRYASIPAHEWHFKTGQYGRPEISNPNAPDGLRFNLSHTHGMIAMIVNCHFDAGVDVEGIDRVTDINALSRTVFSKAEQDAIIALPTAAQAQRFTQTWALKESFVKAMGTGLTTPLQSFSFDLSNPTSIGFDCAVDIDSNPTAWSFSTSKPTIQHVLATASRLGSNKTPSVEYFSLSL